MNFANLPGPSKSCPPRAIPKRTAVRRSSTSISSSGSGPFINQFQDNWSDLIPAMDFAQAVTPHESHRTVPFPDRAGKTAPDVLRLGGADRGPDKSAGPREDSTAKKPKPSPIEPQERWHGLDRTSHSTRTKCEPKPIRNGESQTLQKETGCYGHGGRGLEGANKSHGPKRTRQRR